MSSRVSEPAVPEAAAASEATPPRTTRSAIAKDVSEDKSWMVSMPDTAGEQPRLPRLLPGGFRALGDDLERRSREWSIMVRLLEQQRLFLESAEQERDRLYRDLARVVPEVQAAGQSVRSAMDATKAGDISGDLANLCSKNLHALDELEKVA